MTGGVCPPGRGSLVVVGWLTTPGWRTGRRGRCRGRADADRAGEPEFVLDLAGVLVAVQDLAGPQAAAPALSGRLFVPRVRA